MDATLEKEILALLREGGAPCRPAEIVDKLRDRAKEPVVRDAIQELIDGGAVVVTLDWNLKLSKAAAGLGTSPAP